MMATTRRLTLSVLFAVLLAGCGQKGPLYLPEREPRQADEATQTNGPAQEREEEENDEGEEENGDEGAFGR
jgi:predicted small lipoprotein YifL